MRRTRALLLAALAAGVLLPAPPAAAAPKPCGPGPVGVPAARRCRWRLRRAVAPQRVREHPPGAGGGPDAGHLRDRPDRRRAGWTEHTLAPGEELRVPVRLAARSCEAPQDGPAFASTYGPPLPAGRYVGSTVLLVRADASPWAGGRIALDVGGGTGRVVGRPLVRRPSR